MGYLFLSEVWLLSNFTAMLTEAQGGEVAQPRFWLLACITAQSHCLSKGISVHVHFVLFNTITAVMHMLWFKVPFFIRK